MTIGLKFDRLTFIVDKKSCERYDVSKCTASTEIPQSVISVKTVTLKIVATNIDDCAEVRRPVYFDVMSNPCRKLFLGRVILNPLLNGDFFFKSLTLKLKVPVNDDLTEYRPQGFLCQHARISSSMSSHLFPVYFVSPVRPSTCAYRHIRTYAVIGLYIGLHRLICLFTG